MKKSSAFSLLITGYPQIEEIFESYPYSFLKELALRTLIGDNFTYIRKSL